MDLSIIIVSWNVKDKLRENLEHLINSETNFEFEILVVDNASGDGSAEMVKTDFPEVKLIENDQNLGFAAANNQAYKQAQGEMILLLNPDMRVKKDTVDNALIWARANRQADVVGCHLVDDENFDVLHIRRFPKFFDQLAIILKLPHIFPGILNSYLLPRFDHLKASKVDSVRGGFFLIKRASFRRLFSEERWKPGELLDERYFIWFEEVDFCREVAEAGGEVWYTPAAVCVDHVGQSFKQVGSLQKQRYFRDSMIKYFKKWHRPWEAGLLEKAWVFGLFFTWIGEKLGMKKNNRVN